MTKGRTVPGIPLYAERVREVVALIPPGHVMSYGDVAEYLGDGGPRQVGAALSRYGGGVPWWRVPKSDGSFPPGHEIEALGHYHDEGTPLRADGTRIDMRQARWTGPLDERAGSL
jgi:alkylated DNA nucleotide flippase Atl1